MKTRWKWLAAGLMACGLNSCVSFDNGNADIAPNVVAARRTADAAASQGATAERKGLATTAGSTVSVGASVTGANGGNSGAYGIDSIYYNDRAGLAAMGVPDTPINGVFPMAGGVLDWGIKGKSDFLPSYYRPGNSRGKGLHFVEGRSGDEYSVIFYNRCNSDLLVVLSIDGVNVKDGRPAGVNQSGFVIKAGVMDEVRGYPTGAYSGKAFQFTSVAKSKVRYSTGDTRNVGVIGIAVFKPQGTDPWKWTKTEEPRGGTAF